MEKMLSSNDENYINNNPNEDVKNIFIKYSIYTYNANNDNDKVGRQGGRGLSSRKRPLGIGEYQPTKVAQRLDEQSDGNSPFL